jgi:hypothetical protein
MMPQLSRQAKLQEIGGGAWSFYILGAGETPAPQPEATTASIVVQASSLQRAGRSSSLMPLCGVTSQGIIPRSPRRTRLVFEDEHEDHDENNFYTLDGSARLGRRGQSNGCFDPSRSKGHRHQELAIAVAVAAGEVEVKMMELRLFRERLCVKSNSLADIGVLRIAGLSFRNEHQRPFVG